MNPKVVETIVHSSRFLQQLCGRMLRKSDVDEIIEYIVYPMLARAIYSTTFFMSMVYVIIYLPYEAKLAGSIHNRWMYTIEW